MHVCVLVHVCVCVWSLFYSKKNMGATHKLQTHTHMFTSLLQAQIYIYSPVHAHTCVYVHVCMCVHVDVCS